MVQWYKLNYYGDFFAYPALIAAFAVHGASQHDPRAVAAWWLSALLGIVSWTLVEYCMHRCAFHSFGPLRAPHASHHSSPRSLIGTPTWVTIATLLLVVFVPMGYLASWNTAGGVTGGLMTGYLWYVTVHHVVHHRSPKRLSKRLAGLRRHHLIHHHHGQLGNFGVTSTLWDRVLATRIVGRSVTDRGESIQ